jgi:hypothetical protein
MTFIPEGYVLLSEWLDARARELFAAEYPPIIADDAIEVFIEKHPLDVNDVAPPPSVGATFAQEFPVAPFSNVRSESLGPALQTALAENEAEADKRLRELSDPLYRLPRYRHFVREHLEQERASAIAKLKLRAFEDLRQEFYSGRLETIRIAPDGSKEVISGRLWGGDDAGRLVVSALFQGRSILIKVPTQPCSNTDDSGPANTAAAAGRCRQWLIDLMKGSPEKKTISKSEMIKAGGPKRFKISTRAFLRAWDDALVAVDPAIAEVWKHPGRPRKKIAAPYRYAKINRSDYFSLSKSANAPCVTIDHGGSSHVSSF